ncbi:MAG: cbb3-type cytochrome c oxidase subunit II [Verrucomicrobiota bacterium]|nr:cbb3-type cytochrome c oxidase subunit II [Verrucomicrobiota bacterium]
MNNIFKFSFYIFLTLAFAWLAFVVGAKNQYGDLEPTAESLEEDGSIPVDAELFPKAMPGIAQLGAKDYLSLGCATCHTQQVRSEKAGFDVERGWGKRPSVPRDYVLQNEVLLGHNRVGPDLANVGLREYSSEWLHQHLFMPQSVVEGSICQPTPFLYEQVEEPTDKTIETSIDGEPIFIKPSIRADRLVAYLEALKQDYELPEMAFIDTQDEDDSENVTLAEESTTKEATVGVPTWLADQIASGKEIYSQVTPGGGMCVACHLPNGLGQPGAFPPLDRSDWVLGDKERLIKISIHGLQGEVIVNGEKYVGVMQGFGQPLGSPLNDQQIADVLTYIRNEWGNSVSAISPEEVKAVRDSVKDRELTSMWTAAELEKDSNSD